VTSDDRAYWIPTLALVIAFVAAGFAVLAALAHALIPPTYIGGVTFLPQNQKTESSLFVLTFVVLLPASLLLVPRAADRVVRGSDARAFSCLSGYLVALLLVLLGLVKFSSVLPWGDGLWVLFAGGVVWILVAIPSLVTAAGERSGAMLSRLRGDPQFVWGVVGALLIGAVLALTDVRSLDPVALAGGCTLIVAFLLGRRYAPGRVPRRMSGPVGFAVDLLAIALLLLAVPNLVIFRPEVTAGNFDVAFETQVIQFHQDFFLGPANEVLHGGPMLVDTVSQYGVGSIDAIAAWFQLAPIGNGTLGLLDGILTALMFVAGYLILRVSGSPRALSIASLVIGVVVLVYGLDYPVGALLQHGAIRFGLPICAILAAVVAARSDRLRRGAQLAGLLAVGLASIWALEAFASTLAAVFGMVALDAMLEASGRRLRFVVRRIVEVMAACVLAHLLFAGITLAATGQLPDWGQYLAYLRAFLIGRIGDLTYDFAPWSAGFAVAALYLSSAAAVVLAVIRHRPVVERERTTFVALAGVTTYGVALFSYFVNRSADHILPYVGLPALLAVTLWISLSIRRDSRGRASISDASLALVAAVAVIAVAVAWPEAGLRFRQSALGHLAPGGESIAQAMDRLWHPPPLDPEAPAGERLLERNLPGQEHSRVLVASDLSIEVLVRAERSNEFPLSDPWEDSFVPAQRIPALRQSIAELEPGDQILVDGPALEALATFRRSPKLDPFALAPETAGVLGTLAPLQLYLLKGVAASFDVRKLAEDGGLAIVELTPRAHAVGTGGTGGATRKGSHSS